MKKFVITGIVGSYTLPINLSKNATRFGIILEVDTTDEVAEIQLPSASVYGVPITIFDKEGNAATNNITILPVLTEGLEESIEGEVELVINKNNESVVVVAVSDLTWSMESLADPESELGRIDGDVDTLQAEVAALEISVGAAEADIVTLQSEVEDAAPGYKVYAALLTQTGTDAPVATVLKNNIGAIVWTRDSAGFYVGTLAAAFTLNKTTVMVGTLSPNGNSYIVNDFLDVNEVWISSSVLTAGAFVDEDDLLSKTPVEIRVYDPIVA